MSAGPKKNGDGGGSSGPPMRRKNSIVALGNIRRDSVFGSLSEMLGMDLDDPGLVQVNQSSKNVLRVSSCA